MARRSRLAPALVAAVALLPALAGFECRPPTLHFDLLRQD